MSLFASTLSTLSLLMMASTSYASTVVVDSSYAGHASVQLISESPTDVVLELRIGTVDVDSVVENGREWTSLAIDGLESTSVSGLPELPQKSVWIELSGHERDMEVLEDQSTRQEWGTIRPAAEPMNRDGTDQLRRNPDESFYGGREIYPDQPASVSIEGRISNANLVLVTFNPIQFNSRNEVCIVHTRLRVRISTRGRGALDRDLHRPRSTRDLLARLIMNRDHDSDSISMIGPRMLVVTESEFVPALADFFAWKARSGIPCRTIIYSDVANDAQSLKTYLSQLADSLPQPPEFLLIVGDVDVIPAFFGVGNSLTDHPYSQLSGNDYLPDWSVGRIPCQNVSECQTWIQRELNYERDASSVDFAGTVFSSSAALDPQHGIFVGNLLESAGMSVDRLQQPQTSQLSRLVSSLNSGSQWIFYIGHGYAQAWSSVQPYFTNTNVNGLTAESAPLIVSVACATADLDYPGMSIAEDWLSRPDGRGPLAYFGATETTAFFRSDTIGIGAMRAIFLDNCERLGTAADLGRMECAQCFPQPPGGLTEETIQQFVLLGDPSMRVYSRMPSPLSVIYPATIPAGETEFSVSVIREDHPVYGADVCVVSQDSDYYQVCQSDSLGAAHFTSNFSGSEALLLTVMAHNSVPFLGNIAVVTEGAPFLQIGSIRVLDPNGDNDGLADRGEECELQLSVINRGHATSSPGLIHISCDDGSITFLGNDRTFPEIAGTDTVWLSETFPFSVSEEAQDLHAAMIRASIILQSGDSTNNLIPLTLHAPNLDYIGGNVRVDSSNNSGEWLTLRLAFSNIGSDHAIAPACSLTAVPNELDIIATDGDIPLLEPQDTMTAAASLFSQTPLPRGFPLEFSYLVTATNGIYLEGSDLRRVGQIHVYFFVLDPMPEQVDAVEAAMTSLGVEHERGTVLPSDLFRYSSIWIFCGIYPNAVALNSQDAARLAQYLDGGGNCYWEGGDVWAYDPPNALHPYFHIRGMSDGSSNAGPVAGEYGSVLQDVRFDYSGENSFIDQLAAEEGGQVLLRNSRPGANYAVCISGGGPAYRTVGCSIELGSLADAEYPSTRIRLFREILSWFGIECRSDSYPPVILHEPPPDVHHANFPIEIWADIQDASGIESANLEYHIGDGAVTTSNMEFTDGLYRGELAGAPFGSSIFYRILATDASPLHNSTATGEFTVSISANLTISLHADFSQMTRVSLIPDIHADSSCSWSITDYPNAPVVLELQGSPNSLVSYTTEPFDCSQLQSADLMFWHYLRDVDSNGSIARIVGSTDGGKTFPHVVWELAGRAGILEQGTVTIPNTDWMSGQSNVALRFEYSGNWYWRIGNIVVAGQTKPVIVPIGNLVIQVVRDGLRLAWSPIPDASYYEVLVASDAHTPESKWDKLTRTNDTTYVDSDRTLTMRYYIARAVISESIAPDLVQMRVHDAPNVAEIRMPDLRWNRKMGYSSK